MGFRYKKVYLFTTFKAHRLIARSLTHHVNWVRFFNPNIFQLAPSYGGG